VRVIERIPFGGALAILGGVLVLGVFLEVRFGSALALYLAILAVVGFGALFLWDYAARPLAEPTPPRPSAPSADGAPGSPPAPPAPAPFLDPQDDGTFVDPVIEADQIASGEVLPEPDEDGDAGPEPDESPGTPP
jgi:hypothetical protein